MRHRSQTLAILITLTTIVGAGSTFAQDRLWQPYFEMEGRASSIRMVGQARLFVPLAQDPDSLLFADMRGLGTDGDAAEGNFGLAYRKIIPNEWIVGGYLFYDLRHSEFNNTFHQGSAGLELLNVNWGFRVNGYIPDQAVKVAPGANAAFLQGSNIFVRPGFEAAYWGVDFEAERLLWFRDGDCECGSRLKRLDIELWAAAGLFHFNNGAAGFEDISGPRFRAELRLYDLPMIGNDSRVVLGGQYEHDDIRGGVGTGMLNVRIPFGPNGRKRTRTLNRLDRRMVTPIVRDIDIVTNAVAIGTAELAKFATTGRPIGPVTLVDANTADVTGAVTAAGADSLVIADGSAGTINTDATIALQRGQTFLGAGFEVIGCDTGIRAIFGARPTINGFVNGLDANNIESMFNIATGSTVKGLNLVNGGNFSATINLDGVTDAMIEDIGMQFTGATTKFGIVANDAQFSIKEWNFSTTDANVFALKTSGAFLAMSDSNFDISLAAAANSPSFDIANGSVFNINDSNFDISLATMANSPSFVANDSDVTFNKSNLHISVAAASGTSAGSGPSISHTSVRIANESDVTFNDSNIDISTVAGSGSNGYARPGAPGANIKHTGFAVESNSVLTIDESNLNLSALGGNGGHGYGRPGAPGGRAEQVGIWVDASPSTLNFTNSNFNLLAVGGDAGDFRGATPAPGGPVDQVGLKGESVDSIFNLTNLNINASAVKGKPGTGPKGNRAPGGPVKQKPGPN